MPKLPKYLSGFDLHDGLELANYRLINIIGQHITVKRFHDYEYSVQLLFQPIESNKQHSPNDLLAALNKLTGKSRIIYTEYGNPYRCDFGSPKITHVQANGNVLITTMGHSHRVYD